VIADGIFECDKFYEREVAMSRCKTCGFFIYSKMWCEKLQKDTHEMNNICSCYSKASVAPHEHLRGLSDAEIGAASTYAGISCGFSTSHCHPHDEDKPRRAMFEINSTQSSSDSSANYTSTVSPASAGVTFIRDLDEVLSEMRVFLMGKNETYGDSALNPVRIFSKADPIEQIKVRIDDKLSRFSRGSVYPGDNDVKDTCGYTLLLMIAEMRKKRSAK
jgi:hypothetical protein